MNATIVVVSALLMRALPLVFGLVVARIAGGKDYADFVLAISFLNIAASLFQLGVVPQLIRSQPDTNWGHFLSVASFAAVLLFLPLAALLFSLQTELRGNFAMSIFAAGSVFGLLAGSVASALLNRARSFLRLLVHSITFFVLSMAPLLCVAWLYPGGSAWSYFGGVWIAGLGLIWLTVVSRTQLPSRALRSNLKGSLEEFVRDALHSASFGVVMALGFYLANKSAVSIASADVRATVALGFQCFSVVIFVPGALSSYLVPTLRDNWGRASGTKLILHSAGLYMAIGGGFALLLFLLRPVLGSIYGVPVIGAGAAAFGSIIGASVLAAANAIFNQMFVAARQFAQQLSLAALWLTVLVVSLSWFEGRVAGPGTALMCAYAVLFFTTLFYVWRIKLIVIGSKN